MRTWERHQARSRGGRLPALEPFQRRKKDCELLLRGQLSPDESVIAVSTAEELPALGRELGSGSPGSTLLVVTHRRVLFACWNLPRRRYEEIGLGEITRWTDGTQYSRYALALSHPPMKRTERVVAHNFLWFHWGDAEAEVIRTTTVFRFSRKDAKVAKALRSLLLERNVPHESVVFHEEPREERTRASRSRLYTARRFRRRG
jgi:hypothetical protein